MRETVYPQLRYGSHVHVLLPCLNFTRGPVIEFGAGRYSTAILNLYAEVRYCRSLEKDRAWHATVTQFFAPSLVQLVDEYEERYFNDRRWAVALVDHAYVKSRVETVKALQPISNIVIVHDTEREELVHAVDGFKYHFTFDKIKPYTSVGSDTDDLQWLIDCLQQY